MIKVTKLTTFFCEQSGRLYSGSKGLAFSYPSDQLPYLYFNSCFMITSNEKNQQNNK